MFNQEKVSIGLNKSFKITLKVEETDHLASGEKCNEVSSYFREPATLLQNCALVIC